LASHQVEKVVDPAPYLLTQRPDNSAFGPIPQHTTIEVHYSEQLGYPNEFEMSDDGITVHGWVQNVFAMSEDGELQSLWALPDA
jgi:hypothetical protein